MKDPPDSPLDSEDSIVESNSQQSEDSCEQDFPESLSKLTKRELLDLIPAEIKESTSLSDLKRLSKQELLALVETILVQE